jgi:uncharacterized protein (TIGR02271 family)
VGVFETPEAARQAVDELVKAGFKKDNIGVVLRDGKVKQGKATDTKWEEGAITGVATGAGVGALWALGIAAGALPAIGPIIAGGLLASVLASAAGGAAVAGLVGALIGLGIPEEDAAYYEGEFKQGRTLVTVRANGRAAEASAIISKHGGYDRSSAEGEVNETAVTPSRVAGEGERVVEVRREEARARKTPVKKGEVRVHKEVVTEQQTLTVPVEREEVVIERRPVRRRSGAGVAPASEEIRIPIKEEIVDIEKDTIVDEEVSVGKRKVRDSKTVSTPVRREKVTVEEQGRTRGTGRGE